MINRKLTTIIILFIALFVSEDILVFGTINNQVLINVRYILQIILAVYMFFSLVSKEKINKKRMKIFLVFLILYIFSAVINNDIRNGYIFMFLIYFICLGLTEIYTYDEIFSFYNAVMEKLCIFSLIGWTLQISVPGITKFFPVIQNTSNTNFYFLGLTNLCFRTDTLVRNWGIFREPGVFQLFIIIALIYTLFKEKNLHWSKPLIYVITIFTTFSTTGYIALGMIFLAMFFVKKDNLSSHQKNIYKLIIVLIISIITYMALFTDYLFMSDKYGSVFGKIFGSYQSLSYNARMASIWANFKIFLMNPLFGKGITFVEENYPYIASNMYKIRIVDNTNMLFIILARFGIIVFIYFLIRLYKSVKYTYSLNQISTILIYMSYLVLMIGENLSYSIILIMPLFFIKDDFDNSKVGEQLNE